MRYNYSGMPPNASARLRSGVALGLSVILILATQSAPAIILSIALAGIGFYFVIRPAAPDFYVELAEETLVIKLLTTTRIEYASIDSVDYDRGIHGGFVRTILNLGIAFMNLFGSDIPLVPRAGETDQSKIVIRLKKTVWTIIPLPPFLVPRRRLLAYLDDTESFITELSKKLASSR